MRALVLVGALIVATAVPRSAGTAQQPIRVGIRDYVQTIYNFCLTDIIVIEFNIPDIPVGCEVIDCCPGCPGPGPIDWRIRLTGNPIEKMTFQFDNLSPDEAQRLELRGNGRWVSPSRLELRRGETVIRGFRDRRGTGVRPPIATPRVVVSRAMLQQDAAGANADAQRGPSELRLIVEQVMGRFVVNEYVVVYRFNRCGPVGIPQTDTLDINNNAGADNAVALLDGRMNGACVNDSLYRGPDKIRLGNVQTNGTCNSEVAVFDDNDAVQLLTPVTTWTDAVGDRLPADLTPDLWQAPVSVWVTTGTVATAQVHMAQANLLYNTNHVGVAFNPNYQNLVNNANAVATIGVPSCTAANIAALQGSGFYTANQLNVYYVNTGGTGYNCIADRNIIVIGTAPQPETLSHEIGHAFTLAHVNTGAGISVDYNGDGVADFPNTNVMWAGGNGRTVFTEPQAFRMNLNPTSVLNTNGVRTIATTRACADATISGLCPWLGRDVLPN